MNRELLKAKIAETISSTNKSGNQKLEMILATVDSYSSALLRQTDVLSSRAATVYECRKEILQKMFSTLHTTGSPSDAVPKTTIISLRQSMGIPDNPIA